MKPPLHLAAAVVDDDDDDRPWERPGRQRLDFEPHRAEIVRYLGMISLGLAALSFCVCVLGILAFPLGLTALVMSHHDLTRMRAGLMDRRGEAQTRNGSEMALAATLMSGFVILLWSILLLDRFL